MTIDAIRSRLMHYLEEADPKKLEALYILLADEMSDNAPPALSEDQWRILEEERSLYQSGQGKSHSWEEAKNIIRGKGTL